MILIATCREYPEPTPSIGLLIDTLKRRGVDADLRIWTDTAIETFASAKCVLPLSCWDYHADPRRFADWIDALERSGARLINSPEILRWNFRKTYLLDLATRGLSVPRTIHLPSPAVDGIRACMEREGWRTAIVKPVSGQSGHGVEKLDLDAAHDWPRFAGEILLQAFQPDIGTEGETTMTFVGGAFSHAIRRRLRPGEWRANLQYGATPEAVDPDPRLIAEARRFLDAVPGNPLYARIDGIARAGGFMLMEMELIEPYLYLEFVPGAVDRLAEALIARLP